WGVRRSDFGLADLFGVSYKSGPEGPMHNAYLRLEHGHPGEHPLLKGLESTSRIIHGVWRIEVEAREKFPSPPLTLIPSYPDLPMEKVYPRVARTDKAEVYLRETTAAQKSVTGSPDSSPHSSLRETGPPAGRVIYFPWDIDRTFWEVLCVDHL